jgi:cell division protein FtsX
MVSALTRKSITDLSRRGSRTFFAVLTVALAIASIGIFALPTLMDRAMQAEVKAGKLADLTVYTSPLALDRADLARLASLPNVRAVEPRSDYGARIYIGARRAPAVVYGVPEFAAQHVDVVHVRTTTRIEDAMAAAGYEVGTEIEYVAEADNVASNRTITTRVAVLGFLIVAISMVGLANAITMSVIERTREIGILRTIGARGRDVRRIFAAESVAIALVGWLLGIPVGYLLDRFLVFMVKEVVNVQIPLTFPLANVGLALIGTVALALLITLLPIRRAVRYRPGAALRYA